MECPTCSQQVKRQQLVHFESSSTPGGALGLLYRLYSGMKVRCVYDSELARPLTAEAGRARAQGLSCTWRGALHDYPSHLGSCPAHSSTKPDLEGSAQASIPAKAEGRDVRNSISSAHCFSCVVLFFAWSVSLTVNRFVLFCLRNM